MDSAYERYEKYGYARLPEFLSQQELLKLKSVCECFHQIWLKEKSAYFEDGVINSSNLTGLDYLNASQKLPLFSFIGSHQVFDLISRVLAKPKFLGTQLFFDPKHASTQNYWHRDGQYHLNLEEQQQALSGKDIVHFRLALEDENGLELIPKSHRNWDTREELDVRLEQNGKRKHHDLSSGQKIALNQGDALLFSANMTHRGLYGKNRLALDILFFDDDPSIRSFVQASSLPSDDQLSQLQESAWKFLI